MKQFIRNYGVFLLCFLLCWTALGIALIMTDKQSFHLLLNRYHAPAADIFFRYYTLIAEYGIYIATACLLFYKAGDALYLLAAEGVAGGICQIIKHIAHAPRPAVVFDIASNPDALPLVQGVTMRLHNSFPSGHTSTFFVLMFTLLIIYSRSPLYKNRTRQTVCQILCFLLALTGAYSRIYLSQHFATDIFAGGIIGTSVVGLLYPLSMLLRQRFPHFYDWHIGVPIRRKAPGKSA